MYIAVGVRDLVQTVVLADQLQEGSIVKWAGISLHTKTPAVVIGGNLNARRHQQEIIQNVLEPHFAVNRRMQLLQYNATWQVARQTLDMLCHHNVNVIPSLARSPDLNPIERVWDLLIRCTRSLWNRW